MWGDRLLMERQRSTVNNAAAVKMRESVDVGVNVPICAAEFDGEQCCAATARGVRWSGVERADARSGSRR